MLELDLDQTGLVRRALNLSLRHFKADQANLEERLLVQSVGNHLIEEDLAELKRVIGYQKKALTLVQRA